MFFLRCLVTTNLWRTRTQLEIISGRLLLVLREKPIIRNWLKIKMVISISLLITKCCSQQFFSSCQTQKLLLIPQIVKNWNVLAVFFLKGGKNFYWADFVLRTNWKSKQFVKEALWTSIHYVTTMRIMVFSRSIL